MDDPTKDAFKDGFEKEHYYEAETRRRSGFLDGVPRGPKLGVPELGNEKARPVRLAPRFVADGLVGPGAGKPAQNPGEKGRSGPTADDLSRCGAEKCE